MKLISMLIFIVLSIALFVIAQPGEKGCFPYCAGIVLGSANLCKTEIQENTILACFCNTQYLPGVLSCAKSSCTAGDAQVILESFKDTCGDNSISFPDENDSLPSPTLSEPTTESDFELSPNPTPNPSSATQSPEQETLTLTETTTALLSPDESSNIDPETKTIIKTSGGPTSNPTTFSTIPRTSDPSRTQTGSITVPVLSNPTLPASSVSPATDPTTISSGNSSSNSLPVATIAGASAGGFVALCLTALGVWWLTQRRNRVYVPEVTQGIWSGNGAFTEVSHHINQ